MPMELSFYNGLLVCNETLYRRFFLLLKLNWKPIFTFISFFRVFSLSKFFQYGASRLNLTPKLVLSSMLWYSWCVYQVWCNSKVFTRPVLPLAHAWMSTIMPLLWIFSKHVIFMLFCNGGNHLKPKNVKKCFFLVNFAWFRLWIHLKWKLSTMAIAFFDVNF